MVQMDKDKRTEIKHQQFIPSIQGSLTCCPDEAAPPDTGDKMERQSKKSRTATEKGA
jgi:hypothetical protein